MGALEVQVHNEILNRLEKKYLKFKLGDEQKDVLLRVFSFIETKEEPIISIFGSAGTGKTTLLRLLTEYFEEKNIGYVLAAPTHKAKNVLTQTTGYDATTIHKLLNLSAVVDILELDYRDLQFASSTKDSGIPYNGVLIIDECSMVNDVLYDFIVEKAADRHCIIIWVGDSKQLQPVKDFKISKTFTKGKVFELTKIYRQKGDNPILDILDVLKIQPMRQFPEINSETGSLIKYKHWKDFIQLNSNLFNEAIQSENATFVKLIAYTNKRVESFNQVIRKELFLELEEYNVGDMLVGYDNCELNKHSIINSSDYIVKLAIPVKHVFSGLECKCYILRLYSFDEDTEFNVYVLSKDNPEYIFQTLGIQLEELRLSAIEAKKVNKRLSAKYWRQYFELMSEFLTPIDISLNGRIVRKKSIDYGYCITTHKSQGSNYEHILVDMDNILLCGNRDELRQLQYVALSRTRKDIHMLIK